MQKHNLNQEHIMTEVYSYPFPEVRETLASQQLAQEFMINTITTEEANILLESFGFEPPLELPANDNGELDLDSIHEPVIDRIREVQKYHLPGIETFDNSYPMAGSSQSMFTLMAEWKAKGKMESLAVIEGEYEGYKAYADSLRIQVSVYGAFPAEKKDGEVWFVSNPSARDGNWIDDVSWSSFVGSGHDIVYDAAYVGLTDNAKPIDVSAPNIRAVLTSPSKLFGVFRNRNTGITYTREPVDSMYGSRWFKDVPALLASLSLYERFGRNELPKKYKKTQQFLCRQLTEIVGLGVEPSDVLLLSSAPGQTSNGFENFRRNDGYRFGLTKLFEDYERITTEDKNNEF
jgi:hypothetical protein